MGLLSEYFSDLFRFGARVRVESIHSLPDVQAMPRTYRKLFQSALPSRGS